MKIFADTNKTYNNEFVVASLHDLHEYNDGIAGKVIGTKIDCVIPSRAYEHINVKVPRNKDDLEKLVGKSVSLMNIEAVAYIYQNRVRVSIIKTAQKRDLRRGLFLFVLLLHVFV